MAELRSFSTAMSRLQSSGSASESPISNLLIVFTLSDCPAAPGEPCGQHRLLAQKCVCCGDKQTAASGVCTNVTGQARASQAACTQADPINESTVY